MSNLPLHFDGNSIHPGFTLDANTPSHITLIKAERLPNTYNGFRDTDLRISFSNYFEIVSVCGSPNFLEIARRAMTAAIAPNHIDGFTPSDWVRGLTFFQLPKIVCLTNKGILWLTFIVVSENEGILKWRLILLPIVSTVLETAIWLFYLDSLFITWLQSEISKKSTWSIKFHWILQI